MPIVHDEEFRAWEACVPPSLRDNQMWKFHAYRVALYLVNLAEHDVQELRSQAIPPRHAEQLLRAVGSISVNVAEGFVRTAAPERSRFFGIALGSVRESSARYRAVQSALDPDVCEARLTQLAELRQILIGAQKWLSSKPQRSPLP
jgi:four helix bundle protein